MPKDKPDKEDKTKDLENLLASLKEKYGEGAVMKLGEKPKINVATITTGSFSLEANIKNPKKLIQFIQKSLAVTKE